MFRLRQASRAVLVSGCGLVFLPHIDAQNPLIPSVQPSPVPAPNAGKSIRPDPPPATILREGEAPMDLGTALRLAGVQNPELLAARERVTEAAALRQLAAAQSLPNLNVGSNYDLHRGTLQQSNGSIITINRDALYVGLGTSAIGGGTVTIPGLNYNLNVGAAWFAFLQSRQNVARAATAARTAENDTLLRVALAYTDLLRADGRRAIAVQNRGDAAELARLTAAYAATGQGRKADADRAAVELQRRDADLTQAEADMLSTSARLCQLLNLDPSTRLKPIDGWVVPAPIVPDATPLPDLIALALMQRPELAERRSEIQMALYALSSAKLLPFSPNVIVGFSSGGFGGGSNIATDLGSPRFGDFGSRTDLDTMMFWTAQNLGVGNLAQIRGSQSRLRQANLRELDTLNRVRAEVAENQARAAARFLQIDSTSKATQSATEAFSEDLARIRGRQGLPIEAVDSMRLLGRSRYEYLDSIIDYNRSQFQLFVSLGQPPANMLARPIPANLVPPPGAAPLPVPNPFPKDKDEAAPMPAVVPSVDP